MNEAETAVPYAQREIKLTERNLRNFWRKVNKNGPTMPHMESPCWVWTGHKNNDGYGHFNVCGQVVKAHRVAWIIANGQIQRGMCACHRCDNPSCCRADHLAIGTHIDNMRDREFKRRNGSHTKPEMLARGEIHGRSKLTTSDVIYIRAICAAGAASQRQLALKFGVRQSTISSIFNRKIWSHII